MCGRAVVVPHSLLPVWMKAWKGIPTSLAGMFCVRGELWEVVKFYMCLLAPVVSHSASVTL